MFFSFWRPFCLITEFEENLVDCKIGLQEGDKINQHAVGAFILNSLQQQQEMCSPCRLLPGYCVWSLFYCRLIYLQILFGQGCVLML